jgi:hypothetical protein
MDKRGRLTWLEFSREKMGGRLWRFPRAKTFRPKSTSSSSLSSIPSNDSFDPTPHDGERCDEFQDADSAPSPCFRAREPDRYVRPVLRRAVPARIRHDDRQLAAPGSAQLDSGRGGDVDPDRRDCARIHAQGRREGRYLRYRPEPEGASAQACAGLSFGDGLSGSFGPKKVTAADISWTDQVSVLNPEHPIATISEDTELRMEINIASGIGYVPSSAHKPDPDDIGLIAIDSVFSPILNVRIRPNRRVSARLRTTTS